MPVYNNYESDLVGVFSNETCKFIRETLNFEDPSLRIDRVGDTLVITGLNENKVLFRFYLTEIPGCCGVIIYHNADVNNCVSEKKETHIFMRRLAEDIASFLAYSQIICTLISSYKFEVDIVTELGWVRNVGMDFVNSRTGNYIVYFYKEIPNVL
jgi:hypothetical protein